jgi:hypothetical protein
MPPPLCWQCLRCAACHRRAAAALPPPLCHRCHRTFAANTALQMLSPHCLLLTRCYRAASANAVTALSTPPPRCQRRRHAAAAPTALPPPAARLPAAAELPPPPPPPQMRFRRLPCTPDAVAAMPAVAAPLPRCLRRSANAAAVLPPEIMKEGSTFFLLATCLPPNDRQSNANLHIFTFPSVVVYIQFFNTTATISTLRLKPTVGARPAGAINK